MRPLGRQHDKTPRRLTPKVTTVRHNATHMSAFRWLAFVLGIPITAVLYAFIREFTEPTIGLARSLSTSQTSAQGITYYEQFMAWSPLIILALLGFMLVVAIVNRRSEVRV